MRSLTFSCIDAVLHMVFAFLAIQVGRRLPARLGNQRYAWQMTGTVFAIFSAVVVPQVAFGTTVFFLGAEHPLFSTYLRIAPIANHSRTLVVWALYLSLGVLTFRGEGAWSWLRRAYPAMAVGMLLTGAFIGWLEGPFDPVRHLSNTSLMDAVGFIGLASLLFVLMLRDTVDRALWGVLVCYGTASVVSALFLAAIAWVNADTWIPRTWVLEVTRVLFNVGMVSLAAWRLRLANRGRPLAGLLGSDRPRTVLA